MQARLGALATSLAVVAVVELAHLLSLALVVRYALFPPLAVIAYLAFSDPRAELAGWRSVMLLPVAAATVGILLVHLPEAIGIAIGLLVIFALMELSQAAAPPALAIVLLAFLLHISSWVYPLSVLVSTLVVYLGAVLWRRLTYSQSTRASPGRSDRS
ncbi:MAG: HPP family protein [Sulfobacillus sp.]